MTAPEQVKTARAMYATLAGLVLYQGLPAPVSQSLGEDNTAWLVLATAEDEDRWASVVNACRYGDDHHQMLWGSLDGWRVVLWVRP